MLSYTKTTIKYPLAWAVVILLTFMLYNTYANQMLFIMGVGLLIISLFTLDVYNLFLIATVLAPNLMMIKHLENSNALFGYFMIMIFLKYLMTYRPRFKISIPLFLHILFISVTVVIYAQPGIVTAVLRTVATVILLSLMFKKKEYSNVEYIDKIIQCYVIGITLDVLLGFVYYGLMGLNIFNGAFGGIRNDRNFFSTLLSSGIAITIIYIVYSGKKVKSWLGMMLIMLLGGLLSASRTFFLSLVFIVTLMLLLLTRRKENWKIFKVIIILVALSLVFSGFIGPVIGDVLKRFSEGNLSSGSGRFDAWEYYIKLTVSSIPRFLFGNGLAINYVKLGDINIVEHNTFIEMFSTIGVLGSLTLVWVYYSVYKAIVKIKKRNHIWYFIPLLCTFFCYSGISGLYSDNFNFSLFLSFFIISYCKQKMLTREKIK